jgi:hypothetical protein
MNHGRVESPAPQLSTPAKSNRFSIVRLATVSIVIMSVSSILMLYTLNSFPPTGGLSVPQSGSPVEPKTQPEHPPIADSAYDNSFLLVVCVLVAIVVCFVWLARWRARRRLTIGKASPPKKGIERIIAKELEAEILRRTKVGRISRHNE